MTIVVTVDPSTRSTITNTGTVGANEPDLNPSNDTATADTTVIARADLSVTKSDFPDPVLAGATVTYRLNVTNNGPSDVGGVVVVDELLPGVTFRSAAAAQGICSESNGTVTCQLGHLASRAGVTLFIRAWTGPTEPVTLTNTASVTGNDADPDNANDTATEATTVIPVPSVPGVSPWGLVIMGGMMVALVVLRLRTAYPGSPSSTA